MIDSRALERTQPQALLREFPGWILGERELRTHSRAHIVDTRTEGQTQGPRDPELEQSLCLVGPQGASWRRGPLPTSL